MRDDAPSGEYRLAFQYLLAETRMRRRETTFSVSDSEVGSRTIEVDISLPEDGAADSTCYVPVAFLQKGQVAPSLKVTDAGGNAIAIPTKRENMALTELAVQRLVEEQLLFLGDDQKSRELVREVIACEPLPARVSRILLQEREPDAAPIFSTLGLLEDHFLLWVPVCGSRASQHHLTICRSEPQSPFFLFARKRRRTLVTMQTALGQVSIAANLATGRWWLRLGEAVPRFLNRFALRPLEVGVREPEAARFASCHMRFAAPPGFVVRHLRVGVSDGSGQTAEENQTVELDRSNPHVVVQGFDHDVGHVHLAMTDNPRRVYMNVALSLRPGSTTLWMLTAILTAGLLWLVHHHGSYGHPALQNKQIVAAILLVAPAFASAWSLRAEDGELLRNYLSGARLLLLVSAALSVATALALADILPFGAGRYDTISVYTAASYFVAVTLLTVWLLSLRPTWRLFRGALRTPMRSLLAILLLGVVISLAGLHNGLPLRIAGFLLLAGGLSLAVISANTVAEPLRSNRALYRPLAAIGAVIALLSAGHFLGFYTNRFDEEIPRLVCVGFGLGLAVLAVVGLLFAESTKMEEEKP